MPRTYRVDINPPFVVEVKYPCLVPDLDVDCTVEWEEVMDDAEEKAYIRGQRQAWTSILRQAMRELGYDETCDAARLVVQLEETRAALRDVCAEHGDNDWPDDLHLADVVEKHLGRHLDADMEDEDEDEDE